MTEQAPDRAGDETAGRSESSQVSNLASLSPSETLRAAATRLREMAEKATKPRRPHFGWDYLEAEDLSPGHKHTTVIASGLGGPDVVAERVGWGDAPWITALSPAVAEPLASELEAHATAIEITEQRGDYAAAIVRRAAYMLAFARCILEGQDG